MASRGMRPFAAPRRFAFPEEKELYGHDVVFVGSWYPERAALLEKLRDFDLAIWGPGWEMLPESSALRQHLRGAHTSPGQWRKISIRQAGSS